MFRGEGWASTAHRATKVRSMKKFARESISPVEYFEGALHPWVNFVIMPLFALANAGAPFVVSDIRKNPS